MVAPPRATPVSREASSAFREARELSRARGGATREQALESARRALAAEPDWVAPARLIDELLRADLRGLEALTAHRRALEENPNDARELYLAGRLEGAAGIRRFERAVVVDPDLAWGWHGMAWAAAVAGDLDGALENGRKAMARARDPWERAYFGSSLARYLDLGDRTKESLALLEELLDSNELSGVDRVELEVQAAQIELSMLFDRRAIRGRERALRLLRDADLTDSEVDALVTRLRFAANFDSEGALELSLALAARPGQARDRWRARLMLVERPTPLALALVERSREGESRGAVDGPLLRAARFAAGQFARGVDEWIADLPRIVLDEDSMPRDPRLAEVVRTARAAGTTRSSTDAQLSALGRAALAAGWFGEARAAASALAEHDLDRALELDDQAATGLDLLHGLRRLMNSLDARPSSGAGASSSSAGRDAAPRDLDGLLAAMAPIFARAHRLLGGETDVVKLAAQLVASPRLYYGGIGSLVHPGPSFSALDESQGLGQAGEVVRGLAAEFDAIGRFGIFGEVLGGGGPDGTLLARVLLEERRGEHLGVPWRGMVAWCETTDLRNRTARAGAEISGAALHEGYWIDFDALRHERDDWSSLEREFQGADDSSRAVRALSTRGLPLESPDELEDLRRAERRSVDILLGESERVRLAVLADRAGAAAHEAGAKKNGLVSLDDLVVVTATHEEGHLCDRTRFFPLQKHIGRALAFLLSNHFSPSHVAEQLEYRAELVALCDSPDPRLPLSDVLRAAERTDDGLTPHSGAYRRLLADCLATLDRDVQNDPSAWPEIDPDRVLVQELHRLAPERIRSIARRVAKREGLFDD